MSEPPSTGGPAYTEDRYFELSIDLSSASDEERDRLVRELQSALAEVKFLRKHLPICSYCRKVRDDEDYWHTVESYVSQHMSARFSHSICPDCLESEVEPHFDEASEGSVR
jgi:hypothetical protein